MSIGRLLHREDVLRPHRRIGDLRKLLRYRFELRENLGQRALPLHRLDDKTVVLSVEDDLIGGKLQVARRSAALDCARSETVASATRRLGCMSFLMARHMISICRLPQTVQRRRGTLRGLSSAGYDSTSPGYRELPIVISAFSSLSIPGG